MRELGGGSSIVRFGHGLKYCNLPTVRELVAPASSLFLFDYA
jgi:hypothetical protein